MFDSKSITIVGGGIVGLAVAFKLSQRFPKARLTVLEKEDQVGRHQSGNNSGVLHAGLYYKPGSAKAKLAVTGIRQMTEFCRAHGIPHNICGKLVVATNGEELERLHVLFERGAKNGLRGLALLSPAQMRELEPHVAGIAGIRVPEEGVVDYGLVCATLATLIPGEVRTATRLTALCRVKQEWRLTTNRGEFTSDYLINCAGLYCDRVAEMAGSQRPHRIVPFRGEYYRLKPERAHLVRHLIYPVPNPLFPFLGVHFTRQIGGEVEAGPNAVLAFAREGYRLSNVNVRDVFDAVTYAGLWRFFRRYPQTCIQEMKGSLSRRLFCRSLQKLVPEVQPADLISGGAGVRAQALAESGDLVEDFVIVKQVGAVHVLNAPSPAATASLAIADEVTNELARCA